MQDDFVLLFQATNCEQAFEILSTLKAHEIDFIINDNELNLMAIEQKTGDFNLIKVAPADLERANALIVEIFQEDGVTETAGEESVEGLVSGNKPEFSSYYAECFRRFDENDGKFIPIWNSYAFLFTFLWYLSKGMWVLTVVVALTFSLLSLLLELFSPVPAYLLYLLFAIYVGFRGNYDYYLLKKHGRPL